MDETLYKLKVLKLRGMLADTFLLADEIRALQAPNETVVQAWAVRKSISQALIDAEKLGLLSAETK